ncbi:MAG: SAM-dependent methyltransferase [Bacteroidaceae bacterium]|nr:SAM-dependent methyltransferase [Bacteroidaceae bacterium]MBQ9169281.1 SAM-dependent methyltransferase [Bacteroidaceae bacterium]MBQ9293536.1 SAM-dependent methyltransferase [Bacteroidaceae bacterium]
MPAALYLIPVTLGDTPVEQVLPSYNHEVIMGIRHFIVENIRSARRFLRQTDREFPIDDSTFYEMGKHADEKLFSRYLQPLRDGMPVGVISEAGCPAVADPGADIVSIAQREGLPVVPLVGPNSMIMAVMSSGLGGQSFAFNGYLPVEPSDRAKRLKALETRAWAEGQTQLFIETPYRNQKMFQSLLTTLRPQTRLCIAAGITTAGEYIRTLHVSEWKKIKLPDLSKVPAIFLINK